MKEKCEWVVFSEHSVVHMLTANAISKS